MVYLPTGHDYVESLYGAMATCRASSFASRIVALPRTERREPRDIAGYCDEADLVHVGWPEHLVRAESPGSSEHLERTVAALTALERAGVLVAWTMHNRLPHFWPHRTGTELYSRMARLAHVVIHHSQWGMSEMVRSLPYRSAAVHAVIPHGHYAHLNTLPSRGACEAALALQACKLRFGVLGRPQPTKQVGRIVRAFLDAAPASYQLLVTAVGLECPAPDDPRVVVRPRPGWLTRAEVATHLKCCDCLVGWHEGASYLTSGLVADAVGAGIPMLVDHEWPFWAEALGSAAIRFNGERGLVAAFARIGSADIERAGRAAVALRSAYDWQGLAGRTADAFARAGLFGGGEEARGTR